MQSVKIQNIQALRGIAVLLVVFFHMRTIEIKYAQFDLILPDFLMIGMSGVDLFFVISGFVMVVVTRGSFQSNEAIKKFMYHRVTRIYPLYWIYSSLILCVYLIQPTLVNSAQGNQVNIIFSYLLLPQDLLPLINVGWTLIHEMYFYFIFAFLLLLPRGRFLFGLIIWGGYIVVVNNYYGPSSNSFVDVYTHPLTLEFISGCLIGIMYFNRPLFGHAKFCALLAFSSWFLAYYYTHELSGDITPDGWVRIFVYGVPAALTLYAALLLEIKDEILMPVWLRSIGDASYSIYLSHVIVLSVVGRIWFSFASEGSVDNIIMVFVMTSAVLIAGFLSYYLIERLMLKKTSNLEKKLF